MQLKKNRIILFLPIILSPLFFLSSCGSNVKVDYTIGKSWSITNKSEANYLITLLKAKTDFYNEQHITNSELTNFNFYEKLSDSIQNASEHFFNEVAYCLVTNGIVNYKSHVEFGLTTQIQDNWWNIMYTHSGTASSNYVYTVNNQKCSKIDNANVIVKCNHQAIVLTNIYYSSDNGVAIFNVETDQLKLSCNSLFFNAVKVTQ